MAAHAKLGPSAADRWMTCTASVGLIDRLTAEGVVDPNKSSVYADEGTAAHEVRELALNLGLEPHDFIGRDIYVGGAAYPVTHEMADFLQPGIDFIRQFTWTPDVEIRVDLSPWLPKQFGTMDGGWIAGDTLFASDLKYGAGEPVSPENNRQQKLYALGYWHWKGRPDVKWIEVCIDQPRAGGLKFWRCSIEDLLAFGEEVAAVYAKIASGDVEFQPTDKGCRWCHAKEASGDYLGCPAYNASQLELFQNAFDDIPDEPTFPDPEEMTPTLRYHIVKHSKAAIKWLAALHEASMDAALNGTPDPGSKAVIGQRGNRFFTDEDKAAAIMVGAVGDQAYKPLSLVGITEAEKLLKPGKKKLGHPEAWEALQALVDQPDGKPILVPEDDDREALTPFEDLFDDLANEETANGNRNQG